MLSSSVGTGFTREHWLCIQCLKMRSDYSGSLLYVRFQSQLSGAEDGGEIYDRKTIAALRKVGANVDVLSIPRSKRIGIPTWAAKIPPEARRRINDGKENGQKIVLSHEGLFNIGRGNAVDLIIVHNYFPAFLFADRPVVTAYYRFGARRYFSRHFTRANKIVFLSYRDMLAAKQDFPQVENKSVVLPPPPFESIRTSRNPAVIHMSGTDNWLPKRLSRLTDADYEKLRLAGFTVRDFTVQEAPGFGLIHDRFSVGFKLKLMQMINSRDVIAALCNIAEDIENIAPGYPFYREVDSLPAAISYFQSIASQYSAEEVDAEFDARLGDLHIANWEEMSKSLAAAADTELPTAK